MGSPAIAIVVAMTPSRVIGKNNELPWHIPEDLKHFKQLTMGHPIVMGRKTYESIGKPLPGRRNIVVTRNENWSASGVQVANGVDAALAVAASDDSVRKVFIIGGAEIYRAALPGVDELHVTLVHADVEGDTWFPEIEHDQWRLVERSALQRSKSGHSFTMQRWRRC